MRGLEPFLWSFALLRLFLLPLAFLLRCRPGRPQFLVADGFLIGDCVLLRPLLAAAARSGRTMYFAGAHARHLLGDLPVTILEGRWPWASYDYSLRSVFGLCSFLLRVFLLQPRCVIEPRGDVRSIALLYLCCPAVLAGFDFTGGAFMLDVKPVAPGILHLEEHNRLLADALDLDYRTEDIAAERNPAAVGGIAVSLSGSQPLKCLPAAKARVLLEELRMHRPGGAIFYLAGPQDFFLKQEGSAELLREFNVTLWQGNFAEYISMMRGVECYVGMDSAGGHIAAMYGIPSLLFFGTMHASYCAPVGPGKRLILETEMKLECRPCAGVTCTNPTHHVCLHSIDNTAIRRCVEALLPAKTT